jgi:DNA-binding response OmpR family regulator
VNLPQPYSRERQGEARDLSQASGLLNPLRMGLVEFQERLNMTGRILVIESDVVLGAVVGEVLHHSGHEVISVRTLKGQGEHIASVSTVILDLDTVSAEKELACLGSLQISSKPMPIVLIGLDAPEDLQDLLRAHLGRRQAKHLTWVQKPFRNEELLAAVQRVNGGSLARSMLFGE